MEASLTSTVYMAMTTYDQYGSITNVDGVHGDDNIGSMYMEASLTSTVYMAMTT